MAMLDILASLFSLEQCKWTNRVLTRPDMLYEIIFFAQPEFHCLFVSLDKPIVRTPPPQERRIDFDTIREAEVPRKKRFSYSARKSLSNLLRDEKRECALATRMFISFVHKLLLPHRLISSFNVYVLQKLYQLRLRI